MPYNPFPKPAKVKTWGDEQREEPWEGPMKQREPGGAEDGNLNRQNPGES